MTLHVYMKLLLMKQINVYQNVNEFKIYIGYDKVSKYIDERVNIWSRFLFMKKKGQTREDIQYETLFRLEKVH